MSQEKSLEEIEMDLAVHKNLRRRLDDVDYWRKRAGWFDDDVSMKEFNSGVYDTYYQLDDDGAGHGSSGGGSSSGGGGLAGFKNSKGLGTFLKIGSAVLAIAFAILIFRALNRRSSTSRKKESKSSSSVTKGRSHSRSRSSRSRSRSRRTTGSNYELMDDQKSEKSRKSSRSRSRSRRHSKGRKSRSRSKGRRESKKEVLV